MKKLSAPVTRVLRHINYHGNLVGQGELVRNEPLPVPSKVVIEVEDSDSIYLERFAGDGTFAGDTWHSCIEEAFDQARYEFGIERDEWQEVQDDATIE
ncbi:MAG TPA: hypothetical protein PKC45_18125 [Gemmatales bacterium]|nr:hypothetical protein [Gemmatales bacterium]